MYSELIRYTLKSSQWSQLFDLEDDIQKMLFFKHSKDQKKFQIELNQHQIEKEGKSLIEGVDKINQEFILIGEKYPDLFNSKKGKDRGRLDFDIAEIYHKNLKLPKRAINDYGLWRYLTLNYFIEHVYWRWRADNEEEYAKTAKAIYDRSIAPGYPKRINALRYWIIGERLYDKKLGYHYLRKLAESARNNLEGGYQDYIQNLVDNKLLSPNEEVSKRLGQIMFKDGKPFKTKEVVGSFKRYNAFKLRDYKTASTEILKKEVCIIQ